jgi:hypothetical protein
LISGIDASQSSELEKGQIELKSGANILEFLVEFCPREAGGEIVLTEKESANSNNHGVRVEVVEGVPEIPLHRIDLHSCNLAAVVSRYESRSR